MLSGFPDLFAEPRRVVRAGYPDHTAFDKSDPHYDPTSKVDDPTWYMVDVQLVKKFPRPVTREELLTRPGLKNMVLLQRGSRLSVQPVTPDEWKHICQLGGVKG